MKAQLDAPDPVPRLAGIHPPLDDNADNPSISYLPVRAAHSAKEDDQCSERDTQRPWPIYPPDGDHHLPRCLPRRFDVGASCKRIPLVGRMAD